MKASRVFLISCGIAATAIPMVAQDVVLHSAVVASGGVCHARETSTNHQLSSTIGQSVVSNRIAREGVNRYEGFWVPWPAAVVSVQEDAIEGTMQAYPNPFAQSTNIVIGDEFRHDVHIALYTLTGAQVRTVQADALSEGQYSVELTANDDANLPLASGQYICLVTGRNQSGARVRAYTTVTILK